MYVPSLKQTTAEVIKGKINELSQAFLSPGVIHMDRNYLAKSTDQINELRRILEKKGSSKSYSVDIEDFFTQNSHHIAHVFELYNLPEELFSGFQMLAKIVKDFKAFTHFHIDYKNISGYLELADSLKEQIDIFFSDAAFNKTEESVFFEFIQSIPWAIAAFENRLEEAIILWIQRYVIIEKENQIRQKDMLAIINDSTIPNRYRSHFLAAPSILNPWDTEWLLQAKMSYIRLELVHSDYHDFSHDRIKILTSYFKDLELARQSVSPEFRKTISVFLWEYEVPYWDFLQEEKANLCIGSLNTQDDKIKHLDTQAWGYCFSSVSHFLEFFEILKTRKESIDKWSQQAQSIHHARLQETIGRVNARLYSIILHLLGRWGESIPFYAKWTLWNGSELQVAMRNDWKKLQQMVKDIKLNEWNKSKVLFTSKWTGESSSVFSEKINWFKTLTDTFLERCKSGQDILSEFVQESYQCVTRILQDSELGTYVSGITEYPTFEESALCCMGFQKDLSKLREILNILECQLRIFIDRANPAETESADRLYAMLEYIQFRLAEREKSLAKRLKIDRERLLSPEEKVAQILEAS